MTLDDLRAFEVEVRKHYPELEIAFKDKSSWQRVLGFLLYPFNPHYMTRYTSTFAPVVYFPSKEAYEGNPRGSFTLLAHEFVHLLDTRDHPFWFRCSYLFPQLLSPLVFVLFGILAREHAWPLAVFVGGLGVSFLIARLSMAAFFLAAFLVVVASTALAVWATGWTTLVFVLGVSLLAPWPAPGRVHWERRGYAMSLLLYQWAFGGVPQILRDAVRRSFDGPAYFYMSWHRTGTTAWVDETVKWANDGPVENSGPYHIVNNFLASRGLI